MNFKATLYSNSDFKSRWGIDRPGTTVEGAPDEISRCEICGVSPVFLTGARISFGVLGISYMEYSPMCSEACFNLWLIRK